MKSISVRDVKLTQKLFTSANSSTRGTSIIKLNFRWRKAFCIRNFTAFFIQVNIIAVNSNVKLASDSKNLVQIYDSSTGVQCGLPPVPANADVFPELMLGDTTEVAYQCKDNLIRNRRGPRTSTCDQLTGQWTELPRCICPDPFVPDSRMIQRDDFSAQFECIGGFSIDRNGAQVGTCDPQTGRWIELPRCIRPVLSPTNRSTIPEIRTDEAIHLPNETPRPRFPDRLPRPWTRSPERIPDPNILDKGIPGHFPQIPPVKGPGLPFLPNVKDVAGSAFPEIRGKNPFLSDKELPVNAQVVNRPSLSVVSIIAIQLCAFIYFN